MKPEAKRIKIDRRRQHSYTEPMSEQPKKIVLLPAEQLLRELVLECAQHFPGLEIWITGGWVRDRLLGIPSSDLDLALSQLTGREFGKFLESFSAQPEIEAKYRQKAADKGITGATFTRFHIMEKNEGAAKNLETAGGKLFGLDVDLVNLRKEVYDGQSRNPEMEFGTPEEDAFRRDATVNSMFYHLGKQEIVDLTGRGLKDLEARVMTTPLDPRQTFMDDPLRVLRLIRIGSKLGFAIDPEVMRCMRDNETRRALDTIIKRDRINIELFKMMRDPNPLVAFQHLFDANLYAPVFLRLDSSLIQTLQAEFPTLGLTTSPPWPATWPRAYRLLNHLLKNNSNLGQILQSEETIEHLWTMAAYAPLAGLRKPPTMLKQAVQEATAAIKVTAKITKLLDSALRNFDAIQTLVDTIAAQPGNNKNNKSSPPAPPRSLVGMALRAWGPSWSTQLAYVMLAEAVYAPQGSEPSSTSAPGSSRQADEDESPTGPLLGKYAAFADYVSDNGLRSAHAQRPLLDGNEVLGLFGLQKGGKFLKEALDGLVAWQFDHVEGGVEEAKAWLLGQRGRLGIL
ncbi:hypothetical protein C8A01DRAFT_46635 [Parachaetomium inaequale]|uniref:Poly A polymerase head domain-containing protein n=1 Tax=Parachaetomium inaequale TaxID=2588326 RepID=A0AAN6PG42_9PEZI|nr:hypothetical protein C8A01DRAFT_46635 [Parachaetomium inaequale]